MSCGNSTTLDLILSYTVSESDEGKEWLELGIQNSLVTCSTQEKCTFSAQTTATSSLLDAILVVYDYSEHGGLGNLPIVSARAKKRSTSENKTLLSEYQSRDVNCSVHSVFLDYDSDFPIFNDQSIVVLAPNSDGINMTFCYGHCNLMPTSLPLDTVNIEREHIFGLLGSDFNERACCVPNDMKHEALIVFDEQQERFLLRSLPHVTTCHCVI